MDEKLMNKLIEEVSSKIASKGSEGGPGAGAKSFSARSITQYVGRGEGDTIGLVIANVDSSLLESMNIGKDYRSLGIIGSRTGAGPQILAADDAVKATNSEVVAVELARDTKGGAGHGCLIIFGASDVSDAKRAVEVSLESLDRYFGDVYGNSAGHIELQYTARASDAVHKAFTSKPGEAFGLVVGAPAAIGLLMADTAVKSANVNVIKYSSPKDAPYPNEGTLLISGDSEAVRQALIAAREVGKTLLETLGQEEALSTSKPYI